MLRGAGAAEQAVQPAACPRPASRSSAAAPVVTRPGRPSSAFSSTGSFQGWQDLVSPGLASQPFCSFPADCPEAWRIARSTRWLCLPVMCVISLCPLSCPLGPNFKWGGDTGWPAQRPGGTAWGVGWGGGGTRSLGGCRQEASLAPEGCPQDLAGSQGSSIYCPPS